MSYLCLKYYFYCLRLIQTIAFELHCPHREDFEGDPPRTWSRRQRSTAGDECLVKQRGAQLQVLRVLPVTHWQCTDIFLTVTKWQCTDNALTMVAPPWPIWWTGTWIEDDFDHVGWCWLTLSHRSVLLWQPIWRQHLLLRPFGYLLLLRKSTTKNEKLRRRQSLRVWLSIWPYLAERRCLERDKNAKEPREKDDWMTVIRSTERKVLLSCTWKVHNASQRIFEYNFTWLSTVGHSLAAWV